MQLFFCIFQYHGKRTNSIWVENEEEKRHGLTLLMQHVEAGAEIEFLPHMLQRVAVYCIEVSEFTGKHREKKGQTA